MKTLKNDAHFFLKIEEHMEENVFALMKSIEFFSDLDDYYFTIMLPKDQKIKNNFIIKNSNVVYYENKDGLKPKWSGAIRYFLESKSTVCVLLDADILVLDSLKEIIKKARSELGIYGVLAHESPFKKEQLSWDTILKKFNLKIELKSFKKQIKNNDYCPPCYFNNGFIVLNKKLMHKLAPYIKKYVYSLNNLKNKFKAQICLCLSVLESGIPIKNLNYEYNFSSSIEEVFAGGGVIDTKKIKIFHYYNEKNIKNLYKKYYNCENYNIKYCLDKIYSFNKIKYFL
jgi:hypothetical protein